MVRGGGGLYRNSLLEPWSPDGWLNAMADWFPNGSINIFDREMRYVFAEGQGLRAVGLSAGALVGKRLADASQPNQLRMSNRLSSRVPRRVGSIRVADL